MAHQYQGQSLLYKDLIFPYKDLFFHPIVCHTCKRLNNGKTTLCDCGMVSYCCRQHLKMDLDHITICDVIKRYKKLVKDKRLHNYRDSPMTNWRDYQLQRLSIIQKRLSRKMYRYEKEMVLFSRWCCVCYEEKNLKSCPNCFTVDYCKAHRKKIELHECDKLKEWLHFEIQAIDVHPVPQYCRGFHDFPDRDDVNDMLSFYQTYLLPQRDAPLTILDTVYSDYLSGPLTVFYGMRDAKLLIAPEKDDTYVIHLIGTEFENRETLKHWEIFLHIFNTRINLLIILIGFELRSELGDAEGELETCWEKCMPLGHTLRYKHHRMLYQNYVKSNCFIKPDLIVGFQTPIERLNKNLIAPMTDQFCSIILTAKTKKIGVGLVKKMSELGGTAKPIFHGINNFRAFRPYRTDSKQNVYYRNHYLVVCENLRRSI